VQYSLFRKLPYFKLDSDSLSVLASYIDSEENTQHIYTKQHAYGYIKTLFLTDLSFQESKVLKVFTIGYDDATSETKVTIIHFLNFLINIYSRLDITPETFQYGNHLFPEDKFDFFTSKDLVELYVLLYKEEYGSKKMSDLADTIRSSKKLRGFIYKIQDEEIVPNVGDFYALVLDHPTFLFSKSETIGLGMLLAISECFTQLMFTDSRLSNIVVHNIIVKAILKAKNLKMNLRRRANFFDKYYNLLNHFLNKSLSCDYNANLQ
ncbi:MAG: hypothetical protein M3R72_06515, partial [Bacteroidota bacterium]|nr:hypothetical protein [Bacteroidota bacterium]